MVCGDEGEASVFLDSRVVVVCFEYRWATADRQWARASNICLRVGWASSTSQIDDG
jgi:hypothetical protein